MYIYDLSSQQKISKFILKTTQFLGLCSRLVD